MRTIKRHGLPVLIFFFTAVAFSVITLYFPLSKETFGHDAGIFAYVGYAITQGKMPYIGAWDNKGPLLYLIEALGIALNYRYGIFVLELLTLFLLMLFLYKTALLFTTRWISVICTVFCLLPLIATLEGGNLSEEYSLPFTAVGIYFIAKFFKNGFRLRWYEMMITGACIGAVFLLRLNILAFFFCAVMGVIITLICHKEFKTLGRVFAFSLLGFLVFLAPFVLYLARGGALSACLDAAYFGTLGSFSDVSLMQRLRSVATMVYYVIDTGGFFVAVFFAAIFPFYVFQRRKERTAIWYMLWICFFALIVNLLANSLSGGGYAHYFMTFIPIILIPAVWLAETIRGFVANTAHDRFAGTASVAAIALLLGVPCFPKYLSEVSGNLRDSGGEYLSSRRMQVCDYLLEHSEPDDLVQVMGDATAATSYYHAQRLAASNYFYYGNGRFSEEAKIFFADEIFEDIVTQKPKLIMFSDETKWGDFTAHLSEPGPWIKLLHNDYVQQENDFGYLIYERRQG